MENVIGNHIFQRIDTCFKIIKYIAIQARIQGIASISINIDDIDGAFDNTPYDFLTGLRLKTPIIVLYLNGLERRLRVKSVLTTTVTF